MKLNKFFFILIFAHFIFSCAQYPSGKFIKRDTKQYYNSTGFALIYNESLFLNKVINKKIDDNKNIRVMHNKLKKNTPVRIINPDNLKEIETIVFRKANYPNLFNVVISEEIASILDLDSNNPYIEIIELKRNKKFIAKEGTIFDEEKNVADKAPLEEIQIDDITLEKSENKQDSKNSKKFILVISDFYYKDSANNLKNELEDKTNFTNISVKKINDNKYRLLVGPFKNFNSLKTTYISLNNLGFESLNVYRE